MNDGWLGNLEPGVALLSVAEGTADGLPSPEVIVALKECRLLRIDQDGWARLVTEGAIVGRAREIAVY